MSLDMSGPTRRRLLAGATGALLLGWARPTLWAQATPPTLTVHKDPT